MVNKLSKEQTKVKICRLSHSHIYTRTHTRTQTHTQTYWNNTYAYANMYLFIDKEAPVGQ